MRCGACKTEVLAKKNFVIFDCPECGKEKIIRCYNCKALGTKYSCSQCSFVGP